MHVAIPIDMKGCSFDGLAASIMMKAGAEVAATFFLLRR